MIKAIQTRYKGFNFRSRLEARWAVFFDSIGMEWGYEEEGFQREITIDCEPEKYLPDFRIGPKGSGLYVEVKGDNSQLLKNSEKLNFIHDYGGILPHFENSLGRQKGLILLGDIPFEKNGIILHPIMQHRKGIYRSFFSFHYKPAYYHLISLIGDDFLSRTLDCEPQSTEIWDNKHKVLNLGCYFPNVENAYLAARSARFEHGESGAT